MIYAQLQTKQQLQCLNEELLKAKKKNWYRRLMIIKLSATEKYSVVQLSKMFDLCSATVRNYIRTYNLDGLKALVPKVHPAEKGKSPVFKRRIGMPSLSKLPVSTSFSIQIPSSGPCN